MRVELSKPRVTHTEICNWVIENSGCPTWSEAAAQLYGYSAPVHYSRAADDPFTRAIRALYEAAEIEDGLSPMQVVETIY